MLTYFEDPYSKLYHGDCRAILKEMPAESVNMICTSPPYWGLRHYAGGQDLVWDGSKECEHRWGDEIPNPKRDDRSKEQRLAQGAITGNTIRAPLFNPKTCGQFCSLCGAWKGGLGLEPTPELYLEHLKQILAELWRVLRKDGVLFFNLDDSRAGVGGYSKRPEGKNHYLWNEAIFFDRPKGRGVDGIIKPQDLCLIPERFILMAQEQGWHIKAKIIWEKFNPMPESVSSWRWERHRIKIKSRGKPKAGNSKNEMLGVGNPHASRDGFEAQWQDCSGCPKCLPNDGFVLRKGSWRPTDSYDYIFMLTKSDSYWADGEAVREKLETCLHSPGNINIDAFKTDRGHLEDRIWGNPSGRNLRNCWKFSTQGFSLQMCQKCKTIYEPSAYRRLPDSSKTTTRRYTDAELNIRNGLDGSTLDDNTQELKVKICRCGASEWVSHYATFSQELPRRCILIGCPPYVCPKCGKPWVRVISTKYKPVDYIRGDKVYHYEPYKDYGKYQDDKSKPQSMRLGIVKKEDTTLGWKATCKCNLPQSDCVPGVVLDPFLGSGTTAIVAKSLGRKSIGIDLSEDYMLLSKYRLEREQAPLFQITEVLLKEENNGS